MDTLFDIQNSNLPQSINKTLFEGVPCASDVFRYVQFHNLATEMHERYGIRTMDLYYESFQKDLPGTMHKLSGFLGVKEKRPPLPFESGSDFLSLFTRNETVAIARLAYHLASPECWAYIGSYFKNMLSIYDMPQRARLREEEDPRLALLLSFPNSGTSYTMTNTEQLTNKSVATNYPAEAKGPQLGDGLPFIVHDLKEKLDVILTKSHCNPKDEFFSFETACRTVRRMVNGARVDTVYPSRMVRSQNVSRDQLFRRTLILFLCAPGRPTCPSYPESIRQYCFSDAPWSEPQTQRHLLRLCW